MVWNHRRYGTPFPILDPEFRAQTEFPSQLYRPQPEFHRPLSEGGTGLAVVPDFLCKNAIESGEIQLIWEGKKKLENTLYFGCRKKTNYQTEIEHIKGLFRKVMGK